MSHSNTAILFFSRTQHDEFRAKSLGINRKRFTNLFKFLINKTLNTAKATGLSVIESYSDQQQGSTFSERLTNELQSVAQKGFERVVIIGNDAPDLGVEDILLAERQLTEGKHVLGKDKRGGAYLIGLNLQEIDLSLLKQVKWSSSSVHDQLNDQLGNVYELTVKVDINRLEDIRELVKETVLLSKGAIQFLMDFLSTENRVAFDFYIHQLSVILLPAYRGPPALSH